MQMKNECKDNERLEFLGDAVIGLLMVDYLYNIHQGDEGEMSKKRAQAVCEEALNVYANKINLRHISSWVKVEKSLMADNLQ